MENRVPLATSSVATLDRADMLPAEWVSWIASSMREEPTVEDAEPVAAEPAVEDPDADLPARAWSRRTLGAGLAALTAALVLSLGSAWWLSHRSDDEASGPPAEPSRAARATSAAGPLTQAPSPPVALPADGEHLQVKVLSSGDLVVQQWIRSSAGLSELHLAVPVTDRLPAGSVRVTSLTMVAGSRSVAVPSELTSSAYVSFPSVGEVYVRYRLGGVVDRAGFRALARATAIEVDYDATPAPRTVAFTGARLLSLACATTPSDSDAVPCGAPDDQDGWRVNDLTPQVRVIAQLDLLS